MSAEHNADYDVPACIGCLVDGYDHSCGFVAINAPRTTWNTHVIPPALAESGDVA